MEVFFSSRDGSLKKPAFTEELMTQSMVKRMSSSQRFSYQVNIKDMIQLEFQGINLPPVSVNPHFLNTNLTAVYRSSHNNNLNDLNEFERNNRQRIADNEFLIEMRRNSSTIMQSSNPQPPVAPIKVRVPEPPQGNVVNTMTKQFMDITGANHQSAKRCIDKSKGDIGMALDVYERETQLIEQFSKENRIDKRRAEELLVIADFNKAFALQLLMDSRK